MIIINGNSDASSTLTGCTSPFSKAIDMTRNALAEIKVSGKRTSFRILSRKDHKHIKQLVMKVQVGARKGELDDFQSLYLDKKGWFGNEKGGQGC